MNVAGEVLDTNGQWGWPRRPPGRTAEGPLVWARRMIRVGYLFGAGQASSLPVHGAFLPRVSVRDVELGGKMPPKPAGWKPAPHTGLAIEIRPLAPEKLRFTPPAWAVESRENIIFLLLRRSRYHGRPVSSKV